MRRLRFIIVCAAACLGGCDEGVVVEAAKASREGRVINNDLMAGWYPTSFIAGNPPYLERDYEAGVNFICDEIKQKRKHDFCADPDINWRK